jgi:hypothetical protein
MILCYTCLYPEDDPVFQLSQPKNSKKAVANKPLNETVTVSMLQGDDVGSENDGDMIGDYSAEDSHSIDLNHRFSVNYFSPENSLVGFSGIISSNVSSASIPINDGLMGCY